MCLSKSVIYCIFLLPNVFFQKTNNTLKAQATMNLKLLTTSYLLFLQASAPEPPDMNMYIYIYIYNLSLYVFI